MEEYFLKTVICCLFFHFQFRLSVSEYTTGTTTLPPSYPSFTEQWYEGDGGGGGYYVTDEFATETFTDLVTTSLPDYVTPEHGGNNTIYVTGLFPLSHEVDKGSLGRGVKPAIKLAFDKVNEDDTILPGLILESRQFDTKVSTKITITIYRASMYQNILNPSFVFVVQYVMVTTIGKLKHFFFTFCLTT